MNFSKIHGLGNDYIYFTDLKEEIVNFSDLSAKLCDRHLGIGADGIIILCDSAIADYKMKIYNSDGSEAEMCGNGIRGLAKYIYENDYSNKKEMNIETLAGIKQLLLDIKNNQVINVKVDMGEIDLNNYNTGTIKVDNNELSFIHINIGNPHTIIYTNNLDNLDIKYLGPIIENYNLFSNKTNVEFVQLIDHENIIMKVWERGSGETLSCGTGATASVIACIILGKTNNNCNVHMKHGILNINYDENNKHIYLTGETQKVFDGTIEKKLFRKK